MGSRLFDQLDVINVIEGYSLGPSATNATALLTDASFSVFSLSGNGSNSAPGGSSCQYIATYTKTGTVDFTKFPAVPTNAQITKIEIRATAFVDGDAHGVNTAPGTGCVATISSLLAYVAGLAPLTQSASHDAHVSGTNSADGIVSTQLFDPPIDYATLVAAFGTITLAIDVSLLASAQANVVTPASASINFTASVSNWSIKVYWTDSYRWTIDTDSPVTVGDTITISSYPSSPNTPPLEYDSSLSTPPPLNLLDVSQINIQFLDDAGNPQTIVVPTTSFTEWNWYNIKFLLPSFGGSSPPIFTIVYVDNGTQFVGSLPLGTLLTIFFVNGSGIYKLVADKTTDTLYVQDKTPVVTVDVKIPDPFVKLSYIP